MRKESTNDEKMISSLIKKLLSRVGIMIIAVVILVIISLFVFTKCTAVVNQAGIVRGGSQRAVKQELAGQSGEKAMSSVEAIINGLQHGDSELGLIVIPVSGFQNSVKDVADYWNNQMKPAINSYRKDHNADQLLEVSETFFTMTNEMVAKAQKVVDIIAYALYLILAAFLVGSIIFLKKILKIFQQRVVHPLQELEGSFDKLSDGHLSENFNYEREDEIGALYLLLNKTRISLEGYINDIEENLHNMAKGDLVEQTQMEYMGDYIPIQNNINNIRQSLRNEMVSIGEMANHVAASSREVSNVSQSLAEGATTQTVSIQELQSKIHVAIENNSNTDQYVEKAIETSTRTLDSIKLSRQQMNQVVEAMDVISQSSEEIRTILGTLDDITSQTNMLSLNASIEAARAGEMGKGFAVVAEEVRKLAEESAASSQNIQNRINNSIESIQKGKNVVSLAADSLEEIAKNTEDMNHVINEINSSSEVQRGQMEQVNHLSQDILDVVTDNSAVSEECAASSTELSSYSDSLQETVGKFRT